MGDRLWIVVGDTTDSGGVVLAGAPTTDVDGKPVARLGDPVQCGRHGQTTIASGDSTFLIDSKPVAREKDKCACGCTLLSKGQSRAFMSTGSSAAPSRTSTGAGAAAAVAAATSLVSRGTSEAHPHSHTPVTADGRAERHRGDATKARSATQDADRALRDAGAFRPYDTEADAARAWRTHVLPVSDDYQVEIGSLISKTSDGKYHLGPTYSNGAYNNVNGLNEHAQHVEGEITAYIHTHPYVGGGIGAGRAIPYGTTLDEERNKDGTLDLTGGVNTDWDMSGDLVTAYHLERNAYIADADGLRGFIYKDYAHLQRTEMRDVPLREALRDF